MVLVLGSFASACSASRRSTEGASSGTTTSTAAIDCEGVVPMKTDQSTLRPFREAVWRWAKEQGADAVEPAFDSLPAFDDVRLVKLAPGLFVLGASFVSRLEPAAWTLQDTGELHVIASWGGQGTPVQIRETLSRGVAPARRPLFACIDWDRSPFATT